MKPLTVSTAIVAALILAGIVACFVPDSARAAPSVLSGFPWGDVDCSGEANSIDAALVLQHGAGFEIWPPCFHLGDVNADGTKDAIDAALILQYEAGLIAELIPPPFDFGPAGDTGGGVPLAGDVDCSGAVSSIDAALILQYEAGLVDGLACMASADANLDGITNAVDAALVLQYEAGLIDTLPPPHLLTPTSTPTYAPSTPFPPTPTPT